MNFLLLPGRKFLRSGVSSPVYILTIALLFLIFYLLKDSRGSTSSSSMAPISAAPETHSVSMVREHGYELIKPILFSESSGQDMELAPLKERLSALSMQMKTTGRADAVSIYLRRFSSIDPVEINSSEQYTPGSLYKVPVMIAWLKRAESNPSILNMKVHMGAHIATGKRLNMTNEPLKENTDYTIKDLLHFMICESSNDAAALLTSRIELDKLQKVFTDLSLPSPTDANAIVYTEVKGYSRFLRVLYNATYLNREMSEYALSLLVKCDFTEGFTRSIPSDVKVAHKFGESGTDDMPQLHEAGIFYYNDAPYVMVVMTRGRNMKILSDCLSELSQTVFEYFKNENHPS
jgi:beta-lactamase class A